MTLEEADKLEGWDTTPDETRDMIVGVLEFELWRLENGGHGDDVFDDSAVGAYLQRRIRELSEDGT